MQRRKKTGTDIDDGFEFKVLRKSQRLSGRLSNVAAPTAPSTKTSLVVAQDSATHHLRTRIRKQKSTASIEESWGCRHEAQASTKTSQILRGSSLDRVRGTGHITRDSTEVKPLGLVPDDDEITALSQLSRPPPTAVLYSNSSSGVTSKIKLPTSDTPINRKNQQYRQQFQGSNKRRSSLSLRGRRGSSLMNEGIAGIL